MYTWTQNAANIIKFVMVDSSNVEVADLGTAFTLEICKPGGAFVGSAGTKAEVSNGWYQYTATAGEADTLGLVVIRVTGEGCMQQNLAAEVEADETAAAIASAVWAYATRTLTSFGTLIASIWSYATRMLTSSSTAPGVGLSAQTWTVIRGDSLDRTFATIAADGTITKCQLTVKTQYGQSDADAILAVDSATGLIRLNGAAPGAFTATFILPSGVFAVPAATMAELEATRNWYYDAQVWRGVAVETIETGRMVVSADVTRAVT